jgi:hypothetical protein
MNITTPGSYQVASNFEQRAIGFNFPAEVWTVAAELAETGQATSQVELERRTGQSTDQVREALALLLSEKLVRQQLITWKEFKSARESARSAARSNGGGGSGVVAAAMPSTPAAKKVMPTEGVAVRLGSITPQQTPASATNGWVWQKPDAAQVAASRPMRPIPLPDGEQADGRLLRPWLEQIENLKGGGVEGQLLVYQVFLRVPYQLLQDEGIKSLHFVDERTVVKNPALHAAIARAAKEVAGIDLV